MGSGDREQQEVYIKVLTAAAQSDPEPLCRLRAIRTLGKYKDPRAVACLEQVCQEQPRLPAPAGTPPGTFTPEMNSLIHQEALVSLQETGDPAERPRIAGVFVRRLVVLRSAKGKSPFSPDGPLTWRFPYR